MTTTKKVFVESKYAENSEATQYGADNCTAEIDKFTATNVTGLNATITVRIVPSGGSAGASNAITLTKTIAPGYPWTFPELVGHVLAPGDFISTIAGTASAIVIRAAGREYT